MIIDFSFGNFRSFKDVQTLSMVAANIHSKDKAIDENNVFKVNDKLRLLNSKLIYGANASGKSNVVKAMMAFLKVVSNSVKNENIVNSLSDLHFAYDIGQQLTPIFFQISFLIDQKLFRYGFTVIEGTIESEWLFGNPHTREVLYFSREFDEISVNGRVFPEAKKFETLVSTHDNEIFRHNSLFLNCVDVMGGQIAKALRKEITSGYYIVRNINIENEYVSKTLKNRMSNPQEKAELESLLKSSDIGILGLELKDEENSPETGFTEDLDTSRTNDKKLLLSKHAIFENGKHIRDEYVPFNFFESDGTQKFLQIATRLLHVLKTGTVLVIDELDSHLHPLLAMKILNLFHSPLTNPYGAQLIFTTHNTSFMRSSALRRDQIALVEKDSKGASTIKTLVEFKGVRNDATYDKEYLQGSYTGIPYLNTFESTVQNIIQAHVQQTSEKV